MNLSSLIAQEKKNQFSWKIYVEILQISLNKKSNKEISRWVDDFIIITDLIDDLMDKDRPEINKVLSRNQDQLFNYLLFILKKLKNIVSKQSYRKFINHISNSLLIQKKESEYQLSIASKESDYFQLVNRSVFLMQSAIFLVDHNPPLPLLDAIEFIAISAQIDNDISEFEKDLPYDLLDNKGTLPLIKTVEWAREEEKLDIVEKLLKLERSNWTEYKLESVLEQIYKSPSIPYCHLLKAFYENQAKKKLNECNLEDIFNQLFVIR